ncbi:hypothetical protein V5P93_004040 [Actinokineospora auranticolor]|uniref:Uncharacterized protein n=1 Tax=Actinokineospora auranticolor TaxID=155976 RepID=A0A2S6GCV4_9PSEU|nr:hypothetical protein [Actinokineospora auranticolor]PPK62785.1 hypothetical protein CLV40_13351 [Actinokineospora auranticolor]
MLPWSLTGGNNRRFRSVNSGKCLNVQYGVGQGNALIQYTCSAGGVDNDVWLTVWEAPTSR